MHGSQRQPLGLVLALIRKIVVADLHLLQIKFIPISYSTDMMWLAIRSDFLWTYDSCFTEEVDVGHIRKNQTKAALVPKSSFSCMHETALRITRKFVNT